MPRDLVGERPIRAGRPTNDRNARRTDRKSTSCHRRLPLRSLHKACEHVLRIQVELGAHAWDSRIQTTGFQASIHQGRLGVGLAIDTWQLTLSLGRSLDVSVWNCRYFIN